MIDTKKWLKFELRAEIDKREQFEIGFCKEFFKISQGLASLDDIQIIGGLAGIENKPVHGVAFQSKYLNNWNWPQIKESLEKIRDNHAELYPDLQQVLVYVKNIASSSYLKEINNKDGIIHQLKELGVEVIMYDGWEKIWEDVKYESLRAYFEIPEDVTSRLLLVKKYVDNLHLDIADDLLNEIKEKFNSISDQHKYEFTFYRGKILKYRGLYQDISKVNEREFCQYFLDASEYVNHSRSQLIRAIGLFGLGKESQAEQLIDNLLEKDPENEKAYGLKLLCIDHRENNFDKLLNVFDTRFNNDAHILTVLSAIARNYIGIVASFETYSSKIDYKSMDSLTDSLSYAKEWTMYLDEKYSRISTDTKGRESYLQLCDLLEILLPQVSGKGLEIEIALQNWLGVIYSKILRDYEKAEHIFQSLCEKTDSGIIKLNRILNLLELDKKDTTKALFLLEELVGRLDFYIEKEKKNGDHAVLFQAPVLLIQEYTDLGKKNEHYKRKAIELLEECKAKYFDGLEGVNQRNFIVADIQVDSELSLSKALSYIENSQDMYLYIVAFNASQDVTYLDHAFQMFETGSYDSLEEVFNLAQSYRASGNDMKYFDILSSVIQDYSDMDSLSPLIATGINLGRVAKVQSILEEYKNIHGVTDEYIYYSALVENKRGDPGKALNIINSYAPSLQNPDIMFCKSHLEYRVGNEHYITTLRNLYSIYKEQGFSNVITKRKIEFLGYYATIDLRESIERVYECMQEKQSAENEKELKRLFFAFMFSNEKKNLFNDPRSVTADAVVTFKNMLNDEISIVIGDGFSSKEFGFNKVFSREDFTKFLGSKIGDAFDNIFGDVLGIKQNYKITLIENKYLYLYRKILNSGQEDSIGIIRLKMPTVDGEIDFSQFIEMNKSLSQQKHDTIQEIKEKYEKKGILTFGILKHFLGSNYLELYFQREFSVKRSDLLCDMKAQGKIENIVLDPSSVISILELGLDKIIPERFHFFTSQSTLSHFQNLVEETRNSPESSMSIHTSPEGEMSGMEYSEEYHKNYLEKLERIVSWLLSYVKVLGADELAESDRDYDRVFGKSFYDSIILSGVYGYELYSDDQTVRAFASQGKDSIVSFGSEQFLGYLNSNKIIYPELLVESYLNLIELGFTGVSITSGLLHYFIIKSDPKKIEKIVDYIVHEYKDFNFLIATIIYSIISFDTLISQGLLHLKYNLSPIDYIRLYMNGYFKVLKLYYCEDKIYSTLNEMLSLQKKEHQDLIRTVLKLY